MKAKILLLIGWCLGPFPVAGFEANSTAWEDVGANDYSVVVRGLPREFRLTSDSIAAEEGALGAETRYEFVSTQPVRADARGAMYLRADLTVTEFDHAGAAESRWQALLGKAHPDMGLSYAWDYLIFRGQVIYRLHAACTFSDRSFDRMVANLRSLLPQEGSDLSQSVRCNCGGGCRRGGLTFEPVSGSETPR